MKISRLVIIAGCVTSLILISCSQHEFNKKPKDFKPEPDSHKSSFIITIFGDHPDGSLDLLDDSSHVADTLAVHATDDITWQIADPNVSAILKIKEKSIFASHFQTKPHQVPGSTDWKAKIKLYQSTYNTAEYLIQWKDAMGNTRTFDPLIQIYPRKP